MKPSSVFTWQVVCRAGVLSYGTTSDFLALFIRVKASRDSWSKVFPNRSIRTAFYYPSGDRVSLHDIKAALRALADKNLSNTVAARANLASQLRSECMGAGRLVRPSPSAQNAFFSVSAERDFCQASVVAPPDSPDLGNLNKSMMTEVIC
ncbi:hypothetical protein ACO0K3_02675 [Undibacterium sp. Rencai35W]|uniref:hypothetical protein n=1 Tax=Undibacterium sp. Rencai35W TaxID=3413046 RepID=UPI003BF3BC42